MCALPERTVFMESLVYINYFLAVLFRVAIALAVHFDCKANGTDKSFKWVALCFLFPVIAGIVYLSKRKKLKLFEDKKCTACGFEFDGRDDLCPQCGGTELTFLPRPNKKRNKRLAVIMLALFIAFYSASNVIDFFNVSNNISDLFGAGYYGDIPDRAYFAYATDGEGRQVYYDREGNVYYSASEVKWYNRAGTVYVCGYKENRYDYAFINTSDTARYIDYYNAQVDDEGFLIMPGDYSEEPEENTYDARFVVFSSAGKVIDIYELKGLSNRIPCLKGDTAVFYDMKGNEYKYGNEVLLYTEDGRSFYCEYTALYYADTGESADMNYSIDKNGYLVFSEDKSVFSQMFTNMTDAYTISWDAEGNLIPGSASICPAPATEQ